MLLVRDAVYFDLSSEDISFDSVGFQQIPRDVHVVPKAGVRRIEELAGISDVSRRRPA